MENTIVRFRANMKGKFVDGESFSHSFFFALPYYEASYFESVVNRARMEFPTEINGKKVDCFTIYKVIRIDE